MLQPSGRKKCVFVGTVKQEVRRLRECGMLEEDAEQLAGCGTDSPGSIRMFQNHFNIHAYNEFILLEIPLEPLAM